jgi:hypothetical protein
MQFGKAAFSGLPNDNEKARNGDQGSPLEAG